MRLLEYVEIRDESGQPVLDQGAIKTTDEPILNRLRSGVRIYTLAPDREHATGVRVSTIRQLLPQMPQMLTGLIHYAYSSATEAPDTDSIVGFYAAHFENDRHFTFLRQSAASPFSAIGGDVDDLLLEVDASSETIRSFVESLLALRRENASIAQQEAVQEDNPDDEGAGWPADLPASISKREELLARRWPTSKDVAQLMGSSAGNRAQQAAALRQSRKLLGVRDGHHGFRHPTCQFKRGELIPEMEALLGILPSGNGSGWSQAFWLYSPHPLLDGKQPADVLQADPSRVLEVAKRHFEATEHAGW